MVGRSVLRAPVVLSNLQPGLGSVLLLGHAAIAEPTIRAKYRCSGARYSSLGQEF